MALTPITWTVMLASIVVLVGTAIVSLTKSLRDEDRKLELLREQERIDTYSPRGLAELRSWIQSNPDDPLRDEAVRRYNDCVESLRSVEEPFYDWTDEEIASLEKL
ncbi:hypothetical protein SAMN04488063_2503 [Halopelagius inordinatus]|uniref:Uncharacterized protein n=1 Tax=Halopelagius inordinatus TaxID=553467 RepID=A0A1I2T3H7_9EURY|nr:hypothetical protein [Halopelagius inordinatus]SFG58679.1 hypothetical protein SAMN04488063_2503 [Halopelagius inordinatus]